MVRKNSYQPIVIARLDRAIQGKKMDPPVKPEDDKRLYQSFFISIALGF